MLERAEEIISESQAGFRPGSSTVDQLTLRQVTEKYLESGKDLFCCYINFEKAFDLVWQLRGCVESTKILWFFFKDHQTAPGSLPQVRKCCES